MLYIERPKGLDLSDTHLTVELRDENGFRAATVVIATGKDGTDKDAVKISVGTVPDDTELVTEFRVVQGG